MSTTYTYPADVQSTLDRLVERGRYHDQVDALRDAVRLLEERERQRDELLAKLQVGIDEADRGDVEEWTPELRDRLIREADEMYLRGEEPDRDVVP